MSTKIADEYLYIKDRVRRIRAEENRDPWDPFNPSLGRRSRRCRGTRPLAATPTLAERLPDPGPRASLQPIGLVQVIKARRGLMDRETYRLIRAGAADAGGRDQVFRPAS